MKILRWACGVTSLNIVRNEYIRGSFNVASIAAKVRESHLSWYGHIKRREADYVFTTVLNPPNPIGRRDRPLATWWNNIKRVMDHDNHTTQNKVLRQMYRETRP
ncbi:hypothetical protein WA026_014608 [Henosepilachna vigintioctopunctata]|uniref:Uncharacterized protein n=1 Tax=Henosepilachna vigintioctopunctata TaxID=420089 RepID=A0AAW1VEM4_9CUCU